MSRMYIELAQTNNAAVITAAVITTHHESALRFRYKLLYLVICAVVSAAVITAAFFCNITPFKNAAKDSFPCPDNTNKFIFFGKLFYMMSVMQLTALAQCAIVKFLVNTICYNLNKSYWSNE